MALVLIQPPAAEPVTLAELKKHLRLDADVTDDDDDATSLGLAAREWVEKFLRSRLITQQVKYTLDQFPWFSHQAINRYRAIELPLPPVQSIDVFEYVDGNGTTQTLTTPTAYVADLLSKPARLVPPYGQTWPVARFYTPNAVQITYTVGYGDTAADVPSMIRTQLKRLVAKWWEERIPDEDDLPEGIKEALTPYRNWRLG